MDCARVMLEAQRGDRPLGEHGKDVRARGGLEQADEHRAWLHCSGLIGRRSLHARDDVAPFERIRACGSDGRAGRRVCRIRKRRRVTSTLFDDDGRAGFDEPRDAVGSERYAPLPRSGFLGNSYLH
jgi:hypothetical protein